MSNNIPVNGWPQLKDLEAVQSILNRLDKIEAWKRTVKEETFTGDDITIENALALPARSLITEINAIQDLHGYDHPWAGGAYKNKIPPYRTAGNYTFEGATITVNDDNTVIVNGTSTNASFSGFKLSELTLPVGSYKINGQNNVDSTNKKLTLQLYNEDALDQIINLDSNIDYQFTLEQTTNLSVRVGFRAGMSVSNAKMYPMIRLSTESDATFAPWENKCPISGRTAVGINDSGNLAQAEFEQGGINGPITPAVSYNAQKVAMTTRIRTKDLIYLPSGSKFLIDFNGTDFDIVAQSYDADGLCKVTAYPYNQWVSTATFYESKGSFAIAIRHKDNSNITPSEINNVQLKIYLTSVDVTIQLGTTVYGADINWDTGVCTVDRVLADNSLLTVFRNNTAGTGTLASFNKTTNGYASRNAYTTSIFKPQTVSQWEALDADTILTDSGTGYCVICTDVPNQTQEQLQQWLTDKGAQICLYLVNPTTLQLTPAQLEMLKGYNHITLSDGYSTIELKALTGANWS